MQVNHRQGELNARCFIASHIFCFFAATAVAPMFDAVAVDGAEGAVTGAPENDAGASHFDRPRARSCGGGGAPLGAAAASGLTAAAAAGPGAATDEAASSNTRVRVMDPS